MPDETRPPQPLPPQPTTQRASDITSKPSPKPTPASLEDKPSTPRDLASAVIAEMSAEESAKLDPQDFKDLSETFTLTPEALVEQYRDRFPPSATHLFVEKLGQTVELKNVVNGFKRVLEEQAVYLAVDYAGADALAEAMDRAMEVDIGDILELTDDEESDYVDVSFGVPGKELVLARTGHMVRVLAEKKAGKTTFCMEIIRCSVTGETAFGSAEVAPLADDECILFIDPELSETDFKRYAKYAFAGMTRDQTKRIKYLPTRMVGEFDLTLKSTRDEIIKRCLEYNITRIIFDSYSSLMPNGSVSKEADAKLVLANWKEIQSSTNVKESFWIGHINNTKEIRSSGSILWDASFQALFSLMIHSDGQRSFSSQQGRMTSNVHSAPITLDPVTKRPIIDFGASVDGTAAAPESKKEAKDAEKTARHAAYRDMAIDVLGTAGVAHHPEGVVDAVGGLNGSDLSVQIVSRWADWSGMTLPKDAPSSSTVYRNLKTMLVDPEHKKFFTTSGATASKQYWLSPEGLERYSELTSL